MAHIKIVSRSKQGALTGAQLAAQLKPAFVEQYHRSEDRSLSSTSLARFAQQAMVDCDGIVFLDEADHAAALIEPYIQNNGCDPVILVVAENADSAMLLLDAGRQEVGAHLLQTVADLRIPLAYRKDLEA